MLTWKGLFASSIPLCLITEYEDSSIAQGFQVNRLSLRMRGRFAPYAQCQAAYNAL